jgi:hypothetical protein
MRRAPPGRDFSKLHPPAGRGNFPAPFPPPQAGEGNGEAILPALKFAAQLLGYKTMFKHGKTALIVAISRANAGKQQLRTQTTSQSSYPVRNRAPYGRA